MTTLVKLTLIRDTKKAIKLCSYAVSASIASQLQTELSSSEYVGIRVAVTELSREGSTLDKLTTYNETSEGIKARAIKLAQIA